MVRTTSNGILPGAFAVDSNSAFEAVLTDIPLFCAGLTGLASVTFVFLIKRVDSSTLYLGIGTLLLFIAAILDLGQLLESQSSPADKDSVDVPGLIVAREVGLGLAYGFVFLFAWNTVVELRELKRPVSTSAQQLLQDAGWTKWLKSARRALRWFGLVLVISIALLQVSWRIIPSQRQYGGLYIVESTLEIVTSTTLIFAIILNVLVPLPASWWLLFQSHLGLILALLTTAAIGIGNLVIFAFSEMVLGRFLRAISIYIFLLYHLIAIFSAITRDRIHYCDEEAQTRLEKATELNADDALEPAGPVPPNGKRSPFNITASSRFSKLVSRVEPNETLAGVTRTMSNRKPSGAPITPKRHRRPDLRFDIITPVLSSMPEDPESVRERPTTDISLTYYTMGPRDSAAANTRNREESDSFNPEGQSCGDAFLQQTRASDFQSPNHRDFTVTSFEELMHEQEELDKSIAKLGILPVIIKTELAQETGSFPDGSASPTSDPAPSARSRRQSTLKTDSLSLHSDFSLSVFPIPPPLPESMPEESRLSRTILLRRRLSELPTDDTTQEANPVQEPAVDTVAASGGTNYDVTSFIDTLSKPDDGNNTSEEVAVQSNRGRDAARPGEMPPSESVDQKQHTLQLKPILLPFVANERNNFPAVSVRPARKAQSLSPAVKFQEPNAALRPLLLGTSGTSIPLLLPSSTMVPLATRKALEVKRVGKRQISAPRVDMAEVGPEAFEHPRRPPEYST